MAYRSTVIFSLCALLAGPFSAVAAEKASDTCLGAYSKKAYNSALSACLNEAQNDSSESAFTLAVIHAKGLAGEVDSKQAVHWLNVAAEAGHHEAAYNLAMAYLRGESGAVDMRSAVAWLKRSAELGNAKAQRDLATLYSKGEGVERDLSAAFQLYKKSAAHGVVVSQLKTGLMLLRGQGVAKDPEEARSWIGKAAEAGDPTAQYTLGVLLTDSDPAAGAEWYRKSALRGNGYAMHNLALFYLKGHGVEQNYDTALDWAEKSSAAGVTESEGVKQKILQLVAATKPEPEESILVRGPDWLQEKPDDGYVIQISRQPSEKSAYAYLKKHNVTGPVGIYREPKGDKSTYILTYGDYRDLSVARNMIGTLPEGVQKFKPWVRSYKNLKQSLVVPTSVAGDPAKISVEQKQPFASLPESDAGAVHGLQPASWLLSKPKKSIAVQILAIQGDREAYVQAYLKKHGLEKHTVYYRTQRIAGPYLVVVLNREFESSAEARRVVAQLPEAVQRAKPWVRNFSAMQSKYRPLE